MEFYLDLDALGLYIDEIGLSISIPTWLLIGTIAFIYSIKLLRKDK